MCLAPFLIFLDFNSVPVTLPSIRSDLQVSQAALHWVISAKLLTFGGFLLAAGRAADMYGRRRLLMLGLLVFSVASLTAAIAATEAILIASRAIQGLGAALAFPAALSLLTTTFDDATERNRALGRYGLFISIALVSGSILGGALVGLLGWRAVLLVNVLLGALALIAVPIAIPRQRGEGGGMMREFPRAAVATVGISAILYGLIEAKDSGGLSIQLGLLLLFGLGCVVIAFITDRRSPTPFLAATVLSRRTVASAVVAAIATPATGIGVVVVLSLYLQDVLGRSPLHTGLALALLGVSGTIGGNAAPRLANRFGPLNVLVGALLVQATGVLIMVPIRPTSGLVLVLFGTTIMGAGHFAANVMVPALASAGTPQVDHGLVAGVTTSAAQVGGAFGLALLMTVASMRTAFVAIDQHSPAPAAVVAGFQWALATGASVSVVAAFIVFAIVRTPSKYIDRA